MKLTTVFVSVRTSVVPVRLVPASNQICPDIFVVPDPMN